jgi:HlyD family secretion protein
MPLRTNGRVARHWFLVLLSLFLLATAAYSYHHRNARGASAELVTATLDRGVIEATVTATGTVNPVTTVQVGTYVSGPIQAIDVDFNSPVKTGQRVAKIDPRPFQVKVQQAEANLANARARVEKDRADLDLKARNLERSRRLRAAGVISQSEMDGARSDHDQARAQLSLDQAGVQQAEAALAEARINLAYTDITSPVDGVVVSRNVDVGQTVAASFQTPTLFLIAQDLTKMQVDTNVSESDIGAVRPGQAAWFTVDAYPGKAFHGTVVQVRDAPIVVQNVVTYDVVIAVANPALELKPGMTATVSITTARREDALRVPLRALRFNPDRGERPSGGPSPSAGEEGAEGTASRGSGDGVWLLGAAGSLRRVPVETGIRDERYVEISGGELRAGDLVVLALRHEAARPAAPAAPGLGGLRRF